jgi:FkbM family methyltransferase
MSIAFGRRLATRDGFINLPELNPRKECNFGGVTLLGPQTGRRARCFTLKQYVTLTKVDLVKIDVEGVEADVLQGGESRSYWTSRTIALRNRRP